MDIDTLEPGADFVSVVEQTLDECQVLLAVIGPRWLSASDPAGSRRLDKDDDFVRLEIGTALSRGIRTIPVLVQSAQMPSKEQLPPTLAQLTRRHALELTDARWPYDVGRLVDAVKKIPVEAPKKPIDPPRVAPVVAATPHRSVLRSIAYGVGVVSAAFLLLSVVYGMQNVDSSIETYSDYFARIHGIVQPASYAYFLLCLGFFSFLTWSSSNLRWQNAFGCVVSLAMLVWSTMLSSAISFNEVFAAWIAAALVLGGLAVAYGNKGAGIGKQGAGVSQGLGNRK